MSQPVDHAHAVIRADHTADVVLDGVRQPVQAASLVEVRAAVVRHLGGRAARVGRSVLVEIDDPEGRFRLLVHPDGATQPAAPADEPESDTVRPVRPPSAPAEQPDPSATWGPPPAGAQTTDVPALPAADDVARVAPVAPPAAAGPAPTPPVAAPPPTAPAPAAAATTPAAPQSAPAPPSVPAPAASDQVADWMRGQVPAATPPVTRRQLRESFLRTEQTEPPATQGLRGVLARVGFRAQPSAAERSERDDVHAVSQHWPGVRTIAVVNGKGGANKTPTTALLAATFARYSGAATIAWDNNETRGTLGWRTEQGKHEATVLDLIPQAPRLLDPSARAGDISHFVHHQAADKYDVLRSNPHLLSSEQRIAAGDVDAVHDVLGRYYRLIFVDSGNDESAGHWLRMIDKADQLVVPTIAKPEHAEAGALLLEALVHRGGRAAQLAHRAVVVVSQAREKDANPSASDIAAGFSSWVPAVVTIPYDRAMVESVLRFDALAPTTRRAWLRAAAAVARQL